jgi:hypothetical protein
MFMAKKLKTLTKEQVEEIILNQLFIRITAEDKVYILNTNKWYLNDPILGLRKYYYIEDACDCDDFCRILEYEWLRKHLKDAEGGWSDRGNSAYPALPMGKLKIETIDNDLHWINFVIADVNSKPEIIYYERSGNSTRRYPYSNILKVVKIIM